MALIKRADAQEVARRALVLDLGDLEAAGKAIESQARTQAEQMLRDGRTERQKLIADAREKGFAEGLAKGHAEGLKRGREEGAAKALAERQPQLAELQKQWAEALQAFVSQREALIADGKRAVVELALAIAAKVIKGAVEVDPAVVERQMEAALELVMRPTRLRIAVHPEDLERARAVVPQLVTALDDGANTEVVADAALERGSCIVRSAGGGEVDASIGVQIERIAAALLPGGMGQDGET